MNINTVNTVTTANVANTGNAANTDTSNTANTSTANTANAAGTGTGAGTAAANAANAAIAANISNTVSAVVTITNGNETDPAATTPKNEAVQTGQQIDTAKVQQNGASRDVNSSKAFSVALEGVISAEISELARVVANRAELVKNLPPEIRDLVQQVLNQNQSAQTVLSDGLVAMLKSPKTVGENLATLVDLMETTAGLSSQKGVQEQPSAQTTASKQQLPPEAATVWQGETPEALTSAAKVLRELAASLQPGDTLRQETTATLQRANTANTTQPDIPPATTGQQSTNQLPGKPAAATQPGVPGEQTGTMPANQPANQAANAKQADTMLRQQSTNPKLQDLSANAIMSANNVAAKSQELAQTLKSTGVQSEMLKSLPPEVREIVLTMLQQEETPLPAAQAARNGQQTTQAPQTTQAFQTAQATQTTQTAAGSLGLPTQTPPRSAENLTQQTVQPSQAAATSTSVLQTGQQLPSVLAELLTSLHKSRKLPAEKITELASFIEQAAENFTSQEPKSIQAAVLRQQALEEMAEACQGKSPEELKAAIKVVKELAESMAKPTGVTAERQEAQKVLTLALPLYFGEGQTVYPAYIHVYYQEQEDKKNPGQKVGETWLRICLETENIGVVDVAFRLYDENNLDVKVRFTEEEAAIGFTRGIEEVKDQLRQLPFTLGDILVK